MAMMSVMTKIYKKDKKLIAHAKHVDALREEKMKMMKDPLKQLAHSKGMYKR